MPPPIGQDQSSSTSKKSKLQRVAGNLPSRKKPSKQQEKSDKTSLSHNIPGSVAQYCPSVTFYQRFDVENSSQSESCKWHIDSERVDRVVPTFRNRSENFVSEDWLSSSKTNNENAGALYHLPTGVVGRRNDALMSQTHFILPPAIMMREKEVRKRSSSSVFVHPLSLQHLEMTELEHAVLDFAKRMTN